MAPGVESQHGRGVGAALIYEVTNGQDKLPGHLPIGRDAIERQQVKIQQIQDDLAAWQEKSAATAHEDAG